MTRAVRVAVPCLFLTLLALGGCDYFDSGPTGRIVIRLTDAPLDVEEVNVSIVGIVLKDTRSGAQESINLTADAQRVNLLDYQGGSTLVIADHEVHIQRFDMFRLIVGKDADIVVNGIRHKLHVASGASSGIKFMLKEPVEMTGGTFDMTIDFDAEASIVVLGPRQNPKGYILRPVIRPIAAAMNDDVVELPSIPSITTPDDQFGVVGDSVSLFIIASDADNDPLLYNAEGLPTGVGIDQQTGEISGFLSEAGTFEVSASVSDDDGAAVAMFLWTVSEPPDEAWMETITVPGVSSSAWTPVTLTRRYESMVAACTIQYENNTLPAVVRMRNAVDNRMELRLQDPSRRAIVGESVHCLVAEEGTWTLPDGRPMEAHRYLSTITDSKSSWVGERQEIATPFSSPVVIGQVMSHNDGNWSVFWSRGSSTADPPSTSDLWTGKHVGEDTRVVRVDEVVGYFIVDSGAGAIGGIPYEAAVGPDIVQGRFDGAPFRYDFRRGFSSAPAFGLVSMAGMDEDDGAWAVLYGADPLQSAYLNAVLHEDQKTDVERNHTTEQVGYIVFENHVQVPLVGRAAGGTL